MDHISLEFTRMTLKNVLMLKSQRNLKKDGVDENHSF